MADTKGKPKITSEILPSARLYGFLGSFGMTNRVVVLDDPSIAWQRMQYDTWFRMAVFNDLELKDAMISSSLETRKRGVMSKTRRIVSASDSRQDKKIAEFVEETFELFAFEKFLYESLDAIGKGVSIAEIVYADGGDRIYISDIQFKPQHLFGFGEGLLAEYSTDTMAFPQTGNLRLRQGVLLDEFTGKDLPEDQFFIFSYQPQHGNRWGSPALMNIFWHGWLKRAGSKQWLKLLEKGNGSVLAKWRGGASEQDKRNALDAAQALYDEPAVAVPDSIDLEILESVRPLGNNHEAFVERCDNEIARGLLGQTLTSKGSEGGSGSRALGSVHENTKQEWTEADCKSIEEAVTFQLIKQIVLWNFGAKEKLPRLKIEYETKEDYTSKATRFGIIHRDVGMELSKKQVRDELELDEPINEEDTLGGAQIEQVADDKNEKPSAEFAEKKKILHESGGKSSLKTERFQRLRPSMIQFSGE